MNKVPPIKEPEIDLHSYEFREVLGRTPSWILKYGLTLLGIVIILLIVGSAIFKYPDTLSSTMTLTKTIPTTTVIARSTGNLKTLNITDNDVVKSGQILAIIENPAVTEHIYFIKNYLNELITGEDSIHVDILPPRELELGPMQSLYWELRLILYEFLEFNDKEYFPNKILIVKNQINQHKTQYSNLNQQRSIISEQMKINRNQYQRDSTLSEKGIISIETLEDSKYKYLQTEYTDETIKESIENAAIQISKSEETLFELEHEYNEKKKYLFNQIIRLSSQLLASVTEWQSNYTLIAPVDGTISFSTFWAENQHINAGDAVFHIIPFGDWELVGKALLPINRSGKVKIGQTVNVRFNNFPDNEFGIVKGVVNKISQVPSEQNGNGNYIVEIAFPEGLTTTYREELPYFPEMTANAEIITEDRTLLKRLFLPLKKIISEHL